MKAINFRYFLAAAAVLSFTSCVKEMDQAATDPADCMGVYFLEEQENAKTHTLEKGIDKTSLEIIVRRSNADKEEDVNYKFETYYLERESVSDTSYKEVPTPADDVFEFGELYFEEGQFETTIEVNFPNIQTGVKYFCTLYIDNPKYVSSVADNASSISFAVQIFEWKSIGKGVWRDAIFSDMFAWDGRYLESEVDVYERKDKKGFYRLNNVYTAEYFTRLVEGDEAGKDPELVRSYTSYIDAKAYIYLDATDPGKVYFPAQKTGFSDPSLGEIMVASDVTEVFGSASNLLYGTLKDGIVTFPKNGLLLGMGGYYYFTNSSGKFRFVLPGYEAHDYGISLQSAETDAEGNVPVTFDLAKDIAKVKYAIFEGSISEIEMENKVKEVQTSDSALEFTKTTGKASVEVYNIRPEVDKAKTSIYTLVACAYDKAGNYKEYSSVEFGYVKPGDNKEIDIDFGVIVSDRYASENPLENYSAENSFQYWIKGKDITHAMINYYPTSYFKTYEEQIKNELKMYGSIDNATLKRLNTSEISGVVGNKLLAGTSYTFVIYAGNGYRSGFITYEFSTEGTPDMMKRAYYWEDLLDQQPSADDITSSEWIPVSVDIFDTMATGRTIRGNDRASSVKFTFEDGKMKASGLFPSLKENPAITFDYKDGLMYTTENTLDKVTIKDSTNIIPTMRFEYTYTPKVASLSQNGYVYTEYEDENDDTRTDMLVAGFVHEDIIAVMDNKTDNIFWALVLGGYQKYGNQEYLADVIGDTHGDLLLVRKGSPLLEGLEQSKSSKAQIGQTLSSVNAANCVRMPEINSITKNLKPVDTTNDIVHAYATVAE